MTRPFLPWSARIECAYVFPRRYNGPLGPEMIFACDPVATFDEAVSAYSEERASGFECRVWRLSEAQGQFENVTAEVVAEALAWARARRVSDDELPGWLAEDAGIEVPVGAWEHACQRADAAHSERGLAA